MYLVGLHIYYFKSVLLREWLAKFLDKAVPSKDRETVTEVFDPWIGGQYDSSKGQELLTQQHGATCQENRFASDVALRNSNIALLNFLRSGFLEILSAAIANLLVLTHNINFSFQHKYEPHFIYLFILKTNKITITINL